MSRLIGYVSDEWHVAVPEVLLEFQRGALSVELRSRASGAVYGDLEPGTWRVTLSRSGFGPKQVDMTSGDQPYQFRLLSDHLCGYAWPKAVIAGESSELRIHSPGPYWLRLYRYAWEKRLVADLGYVRSFAPHGDRQILPDGDFTVSGARWNQHGYAHAPQSSQIVTGPERSGLYYFEARTEAGEFFSFPWVVAPTEPSAQIAVFASDITWNAYNDYGGRSNYVTAASLPLEPVVNPRQNSPWFRETGAVWWDREDYDPLSFDRPEPVNMIEDGTQITDRIHRIGAEHVAPAEWRFLGWLEREGFAYDYYSETQFHAGVVDLDAYRVVILSTHPEYWSREMYQRMQAWVYQRGGRLMYLGGNGIDCEVEFVDDGRAVIVRNGDFSEWLPRRSNRGKDAHPPRRFRSSPEAPDALLGVRTDIRGMGTAAPYQVLEPAHWVFDGTGLQAGDRFGFDSLDCRNPGGASGHETDKTTAHSPAGIRILARGTNADEGGAEMTYYETSTGGAVFSVGSICWTCAIAVDQQVSCITATVLRRFLGG